MPTKYISKINKGGDDLYIKDTEARTKADQALTAIGAPNMVDISFEFADTGAFNMIVTTPDQA